MSFDSVILQCLSARVVAVVATQPPSTPAGAKRSSFEGSVPRSGHQQTQHISMCKPDQLGESLRVMVARLLLKGLGEFRGAGSR